MRFLFSTNLAEMPDELLLNRSTNLQIYLNSDEKPEDFCVYLHYTKIGLGITWGDCLLNKAILCEYLGMHNGHIFLAASLFNKCYVWILYSDKKCRKENIKKTKRYISFIMK